MACDPGQGTPTVHNNSGLVLETPIDTHIMWFTSSMLIYQENNRHNIIQSATFCFQYSDVVDWASGRAYSLQQLPNVFLR